VRVTTRNAKGVKLKFAGANPPVIDRVIIDGVDVATGDGLLIVDAWKVHGEWRATATYSVSRVKRERYSRSPRFASFADAHTTPDSIAFVSGKITSATFNDSDATGRHKRPDSCGPIDHAFMNSFVFVKPTGAPLNSKLGEWTQRELAHATKQWRAIFRGDAPSVDDSKLTDAQIQDSNLTLWGDPSSNAYLKKIADELPVKWTKDGLEFGGKKYDAATHMPILIFPNPLNPSRYVVLNSGFTFSRACASGTNSLQTPKLPDWAIVDTTVPPDDKFPGKIVDAGFFDEQWKFTTERPK